jgi:hypothetical protein
MMSQQETEKSLMAKIIFDDRYWYHHTLAYVWRCAWVVTSNGSLGPAVRSNVTFDGCGFFISLSLFHTVVGYAHASCSRLWQHPPRRLAPMCRALGLPCVAPSVRPTPDAMPSTRHQSATPSASSDADAHDTMACTTPSSPPVPPPSLVTVAQVQK